VSAGDGCVFRAPTRWRTSVVSDAMPSLAEVTVNLESPLPASLPAGSATAIFLYGTASAAGRPVRSMEVLVDGRAHTVGACAMPRFDTQPRRAGFWAVVAVRAVRDQVTLGVRVHDADGSVTDRELRRIEVIPAASVPGAPPSDRSEGTIAILMATCNPPPRLLRAQLDSLRAQRDRRWVCIVCDDASSEPAYAELLEQVAGDPRFHVSRSPTPLGFYRNFERALTQIPPDCALVALCDQDDEWHPDKLARLRAGIGLAGLAYCDMRLVDERGEVLRATLWRDRSNNHTNLASMLLANTVTGAATLFTRDVARRTLPFPDAPGVEFHDHWLALVALAAGDLAYVDAPLYDYVQHPGAIVGRHTGSSPARDWRDALRIREWRAAYFLGYVPGQVRAVTLLLRCEDRLTPAKRRALQRYLACETSVAAALWLALRPARQLAGHTETLGSEWGMLRGILWRRGSAAVAALAWWPQRLLLDCRFPDPPIWRQKRLQRWRSRI
jgi:glycosyltransferase involved in cell wall biosynthesis